jgi:hypothetical protein
MLKKSLGISIIVLILLLVNFTDNGNSAVQHTVGGIIWAAWNLAPYHAAEPASGAYVVVTNLSTHAQWTTKTNSYGLYQITVTNPGNYKIEACGVYQCWTGLPGWTAGYEFYHNENFKISTGKRSKTVNFDIYYGSCGINGPN